MDMRSVWKSFCKIGGIYYLAGAVCILIYYLPHMILGQDMAFRIVDYLDDEIVQYLLNGKYFFAPVDTVVEEWLSGAPLYSIQTPTFLFIWPFKWMTLFGAVITIDVITRSLSFVGMFLLCDKYFNGNKRIISWIASVLYMLLPFYPTYALSSMGLPLLIWAVWNLTQEKEKKSQYAVYYAILAVFALGSSFALTGYFVVGFMGLYMIILFVKKKKCAGYRILGGCGLITILYCYVFRSTIYQILFDSAISHRSDPDRIYEPLPFWDSFMNMFKYGQYHAPSVHTYVMAFALGVIVLGFLFWEKLDDTTKKQVKCALVLWLAALGIAVFNALYRGVPGVLLRQVMGVLKSFQLERIFWANPMIWYFELAVSSAVFVKLISVVIKNSMFCKIVSAGFLTAMGLFLGRHIITHIDNIEYFSSVKSIFTKENDQLTYRDFYDHEVFEEIEEYIGRDQSEYRVASIGMVPAIASANGFYTVDGYSNNYTLEYKKTFRKVIEKELDKSGEIKAYYDNWGSRCYMFCAELGLDYRFGKDENVVIEQLDIDTKALAELGCEYIFSAVRIENATEINLELLDVFSREDGFMEVYLYEIVDVK
ncbi:MAG: hypothetical protein IJX86_03515 [Lachnospiraceae bacterium]|nr:hypothetical protein [Lachnospiraceae bacterium]